MTNEIRPALTADEWNRVRSARTYLDVMLDPSPFGKAPEPDHFRAIALANDALPDDDPRKLTHDDVKQVERASGTMEAEWGIQGGALERLAAKLAALLPPHA